LNKNIDIHILGDQGAASQDDAIFSGESSLEGPEGVKWELGIGQIFTGKVGFGSLGLGFGHWEWESQTEKQ